MIETILIIDDEKLIVEYLEEILTRKKYRVLGCQTAEKGLKALKEESYDLILLDMKLKGTNGLEVLKKIKEISPDSLTIVMTAFGSIENAVEAMRLGAFYYLLKPFSGHTLDATIEKAKSHTHLVEENRYLRKTLQDQPSLFIAKSPSLIEIAKMLPQIALAPSPVMITGESGVGKEVIANAIHELSSRAKNPFIKINCAAIPETLIESEFFGHEKGSFTGAHQRRKGRFELAHNGTLLLDEVTEIPPETQAKLLRVLQEQTFERVGGSQQLNTDVRIISTTNRPLLDNHEKHYIREDLFYRLNVLPIHIPPLRERVEDILPLAEHFLEQFSHKNHKECCYLTEEAKQALLTYPWPGNVRELANLMERACVLSETPKITLESLFTTQEMRSFHTPLGLSLEEIEQRYVIETLNALDSDLEKAAEQLGITVEELLKRRG